MLYAKIVTYIPNLINKVDIKGVVLLTKNGKRISVLTNKECGNRVADRISATDESRRIILIEQPLIGSTDEYDEAEMLNMLKGAAILHADTTFDNDTLFTNEVWIEEFSLYNSERQVSITRPLLRNFWRYAFIAFKQEQLYENRSFDRCYAKAVSLYLQYEMEENPLAHDSDDMLRIAEATKEDVWDTYDRIKAMERERYLKGA